MATIPGDDRRNGLNKTPYGFMVLLGFFSLAGILVNNGIVLIDRIEFEKPRAATPEMPSFKRVWPGFGPS